MRKEQFKKKIVKYKLRCYSIIRVIYCEFLLNNIFISMFRSKKKKLIYKFDIG